MRAAAAGGEPLPAGESKSRENGESGDSGESAEQAWSRLVEVMGSDAATELRSGAEEIDLDGEAKTWGTPRWRCWPRCCRSAAR